MPVYKDMVLENGCHLLLWKIEESIEQLKAQVTLHNSDLDKLSTYTHPEKQREFLALRACLKIYFGDNPPVYYHKSGKPYLKTGHFISFSHTHGFSGLIINPNAEVGIDLEKYRPTIKRIAPKFMAPNEYNAKYNAHEIEQITYIWGAKEVVVKIEGNKKLHFIEQIKIEPFKTKSLQATKGKLYLEKQIRNFEFRFLNFENLYLSYGWKTLAE